MSDYIIFTVGNNGYALAVDQVERISPIANLTPVPNAHPFIDGMMLYQNQAIRVVNFRKMTMMNAPEETDDAQSISHPHQKLLIYQGEEGFFAIKVDTIQDIAQIDESAIKQYTSTVDIGDYLQTQGVIEYKKRLIIVIKALKLPQEAAA